MSDAYLGSGAQTITLPRRPSRLAMCLTAFYRDLVDGDVPTDLAAEITRELALKLIEVGFYQSKDLA